MTYIEGFVAAVPAENKEAYIRHAADAASLFKEFGVTRMVENWGDDVPDGKVTDFKQAVQAKEGEVVIFSWFEYPNRQVRDAAIDKMMSDPRMKEMGAAMPFDAKRMIVGGFESFVDECGGGTMGYADGYLLAVPSGKKDAYRDLAQMAAVVFKEYGAIRIVEAWADDVPDGTVTDYKRAVQAKDDETVVYSWVEWPSREVRDAAWPKIKEDERLKSGSVEMPFDGKRMIYGGFCPVLDV